MFDDYVDEFNEIYDKCQDLVSELPKLQGEPRKEHIRVISREMERLSQILDSCESLQSKETDTREKARMNKEVRNLRTDYQSLYREFQSSKEYDSRYEREELFRDRRTRGEMIDRDNRQRLLKTQKMLEDTNNSLLRSEGISEQNEQMGIEIMNDLATQKESLLNSSRVLDDTLVEQDRTRHLTRSIWRRSVMNKVILILIILILISAIGALVYLKIIKNNK